MKERGLLYAGIGDGFIEVTIQRILGLSFSTNSMLVAWLIAIIGFFASITILGTFIRKHFNQANPGTVAAMLLLGNSIGAILLNYLLSVNFPEERIAVYFIPFFILTLGYFIEGIAHKLPKLKWAVVILWAFPISLLAQLNLNHTLQWFTLPVSETVYTYFKTEQEKVTDPLMISGYWLLEMSWGYNNVRSNNLIAPFSHSKRDSLHISDFMVCYADSCSQYESDYQEVFTDASNMKVMKRKSDLDFKFLYAPKLPMAFSDAHEYHNLVEITNDTLIRAANMVELEMTVNSGTIPLNTNIVITTSKATDSNLYYDFIPLKWIRNNWEGQTLKFRRPMKLPADSETLKIYLWNVEKVQQEFKVESVKLYSVVPK